jgi:hypothetical protein
VDSVDAVLNLETETMRKAASISSIIVFFAMAIIGMASGTPPFTCSLRALAGAAIAFLLVRVAGRIVVRILVDALMGSLASTSEEKDRSP